MAPLLSPSLILGFSVTLILISPSLSLTCTSQNFTNNVKYANCTDLPSLNSYLHWTFDSAKSSLSIAFLAPPAKSAGWIAWAINPTGTGMLGSQSLIAFKQSNGSMTVNTYNITSYRAIAPSKISFAVSDARAEHSGGLMKIFATLALPANMTEVNQVWQVGSSVTGGVPDKHDMMTANTNSKGTLALMKAQSNGTSGGNNSSTSTNSSTGGQSPSAPENGAISMNKKSNAVFYVCLLFLGILALF